MMTLTTTSVDSNVIVDILNQDHALNQRTLAAIENSRQAGPLIVSGPVYSELMGLPTRTRRFSTNSLQLGILKLTSDLTRLSGAQRELDLKAMWNEGWLILDSFHAASWQIF
jgi:predicted nucleic acid-binding protein